VPQTEVGAAQKVTEVEASEHNSVLIRFPDTETQDDVPELEEVSFPRHEDDESLSSNGSKRNHAKRIASVSSPNKEVHFREFEQDDDNHQDENAQDNGNEYTEAERAEWKRLRSEARRLHCDAWRTGGNLAAGAAFVGGVAHLRKLRRRQQKEAAKEAAKVASSAPVAPSTTDC